MGKSICLVLGAALVICAGLLRLAPASAASVTSSSSTTTTTTSTSSSTTTSTATTAATSSSSTATATRTATSQRAAQPAPAPFGLTDPGPVSSDSQHTSFGSQGPAATPWPALGGGAGGQPAPRVTALTSDSPSASVLVGAMSVLFAGIAIAAHLALRMRTSVARRRRPDS